MPRLGPTGPITKGTFSRQLRACLGYIPEWYQSCLNNSGYRSQEIVSVFNVIIINIMVIEIIFRLNEFRSGNYFTLGDHSYDLKCNPWGIFEYLKLLILLCIWIGEALVRGNTDFRPWVNSQDIKEKYDYVLKNVEKFRKIITQIII